MDGLLQRGATAVLMAFVSWLAFGTESWQAFFHWMPMFSQAFLTEGKATWWKLQSLFSLVRFLGGTEQLAWAFQWILTATVAVVLVVMWRSRVSYSLKAAALATGTLLITPYLFMYDMMVLAIPVAFLVRIGLKSGFRPYELPALGCAVALIFSFIFLGAPVGLGATLIVATLIMRRAGPWRRREPAVPAAVAAPRRRSAAAPRRHLERHICFLSSALNSCSVLQSDLRRKSLKTVKTRFGRALSAGPRAGTRNAPWCIGGPIKS